MKEKDQRRERESIDFLKVVEILLMWRVTLAHGPGSVISKKESPQFSKFGKYQLRRL